MTKLSEEKRQELIAEALQMREKAYAPYSGFKVGAAILGQSGRIYGGCNVENASYGGAICAERTAAVKAVSEGEKRFGAIAVTGRRDETPPEEAGYTYPCGICRQFLREFCSDDVPVFIIRSADDYRETSCGALLPDSFGPEDL